MKIRLLSDLHLEFSKFQVPALPEDRGTVLVLAGDILPACYWRFHADWLEDLASRFLSVIYVAGNHEFYHSDYDEALGLLRSMCLDLGVIFLENDTVSIGDCTFAGCTLWSDSSAAPNLVEAKISDYRNIHTKGHKITSKETTALHAASVNFLTQATYDIVVTHHAPLIQCTNGPIFDQLHVAYVTDLRYLIEEKRPRAWMYGHTHTAYECQCGDTWVLTNPQGYPGELNGFQPGMQICV